MLFVMNIEYHLIDGHILVLWYGRRQNGNLQMPWFPIFGNWVKYTSSHNVAMLAIGVFAGHPYMFAKVFGRGSLSKVIIYYIYITYTYIYIDICITHYKVTPGYPSPPRGVEGVPRDDLHSKSSELLLQGTARFLALKSCGQQPFFFGGWDLRWSPTKGICIYICVYVYMYMYVHVGYWNIVHWHYLMYTIYTYVWLRVRHCHQAETVAVKEMAGCRNRFHLSVTC